MYVREILNLSVSDLLTLAGAARDWFRVAAEKGRGEDEELARERLYDAIRPILVGRSTGGVCPLHDDSGYAMREWEGRRDALVREVALVRPWGLVGGERSPLRGGDMVAASCEVVAWTKALAVVGLEWADVEAQARALALTLPVGEVASVDRIVAFLVDPASAAWPMGTQPKRVAKDLGVSWEALVKKSKLASSTRASHATGASPP